MGEQTAISWCDHTFNPFWGCWKIADECKNCYAESLANHYAAGHWGRTAPRRFFGDKHWNEPRKWNHKAEADGVRRRVFVGSMCDWAEIHPIDEVRRQQDEARERLWSLIRECPALDWLLLTKRIEDVADHNLLPWLRCQEGAHDREPYPHVWLGVTAGTCASLTKVATLRTIPAAKHWISCEPLLEHISRADWDWALFDGHAVAPIDWLIVGDESASQEKRRPAQPDWIRTAREAALAHGVAFHFKQWNGPETGGIAGRDDGKRKIHLPLLDGKRWAQFPR